MKSIGSFLRHDIFIYTLLFQIAFMPAVLMGHKAEVTGASRVKATAVANSSQETKAPEHPGRFNYFVRDIVWDQRFVPQLPQGADASFFLGRSEPPSFPTLKYQGYIPNLNFSSYYGELDAYILTSELNATPRPPHSGTEPAPSFGTTLLWIGIEEDLASPELKVVIDRAAKLVINLKNQMAGKNLQVIFGRTSHARQESLRLKITSPESPKLVHTYYQYDSPTWERQMRARLMQRPLEPEISMSEWLRFRFLSWIKLKHKGRGQSANSAEPHSSKKNKTARKELLQYHQKIALLRGSVTASSMTLVYSIAGLQMGNSYVAMAVLYQASYSTVLSWFPQYYAWVFAKGDQMHFGKDLVYLMSQLLFAYPAVIILEQGGVEWFTPGLEAANNFDMLLEWSRAGVTGLNSEWIDSALHNKRDILAIFAFLTAWLTQGFTQGSIDIGISIYSENRLREIRRGQTYLRAALESDSRLPLLQGRFSQDEEYIKFLTSTTFVMASLLGNGISNLILLGSPENGLTDLGYSLLWMTAVFGVPYRIMMVNKYGHKASRRAQSNSNSRCRKELND